MPIIKTMWADKVPTFFRLSVEQMRSLEVTEHITIEDREDYKNEDRDDYKKITVFVKVRSEDTLIFSGSWIFESQIKAEVFALELIRFFDSALDDKYVLPDTSLLLSNKKMENQLGGTMIQRAVMRNESIEIQRAVMRNESIELSGTIFRNNLVGL